METKQEKKARLRAVLNQAGLGEIVKLGGDKDGSRDNK